MIIAGVGVDLVEVDAFAEQLDRAGSRFADAFTPREWRDADASTAGRAASLAARWAAKEAFVKAWSGALYGEPPVISDHRWTEIEVRLDRWRRPSLLIHGDVAAAVEESVGDVEVEVSLSHDGGNAVAYVVLSARERAGTR